MNNIITYPPSTHQELLPIIQVMEVLHILKAGEEIVNWAFDWAPTAVLTFPWAPTAVQYILRCTNKDSIIQNESMVKCM